MSNVLIKVKSYPYYTGTKSLDNNMYTLTFRWNTYTEKWHMDLLGLNNDVDIKGIALVPGKDLLGAHGYSELGQLWVYDHSDAEENPNYDDFGGRFTLEYVPLSDL